LRFSGVTGVTGVQPCIHAGSGRDTAVTPVPGSVTGGIQIRQIVTPVTLAFFQMSRHKPCIYASRTPVTPVTPQKHTSAGKVTMTNTNLCTTASTAVTPVDGPLAYMGHQWAVAIWLHVAVILLLNYAAVRL